MVSRRLLVGVSAALLVSCGRDSGPEKGRAEPTGAASVPVGTALARLRAVPVLGARPASAIELAATPFGFAPRVKGALEVIVPRTARGPLRVGRDAVRYVDVTAEHERDPHGALEANTMVYADASRDKPKPRAHTYENNPASQTCSIRPSPSALCSGKIIFRKNVGR